MKRVLLLMTMLLSLIGVGAQTSQNGSQASQKKMGLFDFFRNPTKSELHIAKDMIDGFNNRFLIGGPRDIDANGIDNNGIKGKVCMQALATVSDTVYSLSFYLIRSGRGLDVRKGAPLLIKFKSGKVLSLKSDNFREDMIGDTYTMSGVVSTAYSIVPTYSITEEEMEYFKGGIEKMRLEVSSDICDFNLKTDNISSFLYAEYGMLKMAVNKKRSFYDGYTENVPDELKKGSEATIDGIKCIVVLFHPTGIIITTESKLSPKQVKELIKAFDIQKKVVQIYLNGNSEMAYAGVTDNGYHIDYETNTFTKLSDIK